MDNVRSAQTSKPASQLNIKHRGTVPCEVVLESVELVSYLELGLPDSAVQRQVDIEPLVVSAKRVFFDTIQQCTLKAQLGCDRVAVLSSYRKQRDTPFVGGAVIGIRENVYIDSTRAIGCPTARVIFRHILPNIMAPTIVLFSTRVPNVILTEASLSFLGYGIPPPEPSWGSMLSSGGRRYMLMQPYMVIWPGLALSIVVYGVNIFGDAVRDLLDPRLRGTSGRYGTGKTEKKPLEKK